MAATRALVRGTRRFQWAGLLLACILCGSAQGQMVPWLTRAFSNDRSGWNDQEVQLTQTSVISRGINFVTVVPVYGDERGMEAQPLILPNVATSKGMRDVMVLPSMANQVRGVDAHTGEDLWDTPLDTPIMSNGGIDMHMINDHWGCLSTGVIDPGTALLYQVCWMSPDNSGTPDTARYMMYVLNVANGKKVGSREIDGLNFNTAMRKARSSAALIQPQGIKTILQCTGSVLETAKGSSGYCFAYDIATAKITAMISTTGGDGAGIWMAGAGLACDANQDCYAITGNGGFNGVDQWGESFIKLHYVPPTASQAASLKIVDNWTPWTDEARAGAAASSLQKLADKPAGMSLMSEAVRPVGGGMSLSLKNATTKVTRNAQGQPVLLVYPQLSPEQRTDQDLGSGGIAYVRALNIVCGGGKDGLLYCMHADHLGGTRPADLADARKNCAKLVGGTPVWSTMDPGPNIDPCPGDPRQLNFLPFGDTAHIHATPVVMWDPLLNTWTLFVWGENQQLHKWGVNVTRAPWFIAQGRDFASPDVRGTSPGGMPGGFCSGSSHGTDPNTYLLVCAVPHGDANSNPTVLGHIVVYDPVHLDAQGFLKKLWDSDDWGWSGNNAQAKYWLFNKFMPPVIDGGEIILPNYHGGVLIAH